MKAIIYVNWDTNEVFGNFDEAWNALVANYKFIGTINDLAEWCECNGWEDLDLNDDDLDFYDTDAGFEYQDDMINKYYTIREINIY